MFRARFPALIVLVLSLWIFALACEPTGNTEPQSTVETAESTGIAPAGPTSAPVTGVTPNPAEAQPSAESPTPNAIQQEPTATSETPTTLEPTATATPSPARTPIHVVISGSGIKAETVSLPEGLYIVDMVVTENEVCIEGTCTEGIFTVEIGGIDEESHLFAFAFLPEWSASLPLRIGTGFLEMPPGTQVVSVEAEGDWTIAFDSVIYEEPPIADGTDVVLSGSGTKAVKVNLPRGSYIVDSVVTDNERCTAGDCSPTNFIVHIEGANEGIDFLANENASEWSGSWTLGIGIGVSDVPPGTQVVSVDASGDWTITFEFLG